MKEKEKTKKDFLKAKTFKLKKRLPEENIRIKNEIKKSTIMIETKNERKRSKNYEWIMCTLKTKEKESNK